MTLLRILRVVLPTIAALALVLLPSSLGSPAPETSAGPLTLAFGPVNLTLVAYIAGLTWLVARYSAVNLRGQHRLGRYGAAFTGLTASLLLLVTAADLTSLAVAWTVSGALIGMLVGHADTAAARAAAHRVHLTMGASSALLWLGVLAASLDLAAAPPLVAALVVAAAVVRSALAPFHRWLPETAEAPSPVSALLHAGIVNAAGILAVLQWELLAKHPAVLVSLAVVGLLTVAWCTLEQRVRPDVKGRLAASTSAQMGWMSLQIGLGAPAAALLHLMGHGAWKAWLFLRAGGAVSRARRETAPLAAAASRLEGLTNTGVALLPLTALVLTALIAPPAALAGPLPAIQVLLLGLAVLVAVAVGREAARLERSSRGLRTVVAAFGGLAAAGYLTLATLWDEQLGAYVGLTHPAYADGLVATALALAGLGAVIVLGRAAGRLQPGSTHPVATLVAAPGLPRLRPEGTDVAIRVEDVEAVDVGERTGDTRQVVELAGRVVGAAWPLRSTVAVNPLSGLESLSVDTALSVAERLHGVSLRPSHAWFLDLHQAGQITDEALLRAMTAHGLGGGRSGVEGLLDLTRRVSAHTAHTARTAHTEPARTGTARHVTLDGALEAALTEAHTWTARAWHRTEDRTGDLHGPWHLWHAAAAHPVYRLAAGAPGVRGDVFARSLPQDPAAAVTALLRHSGLGEDALFDVVAALLGAGPGWAAHAQWRARRSGGSGPLVELVALRLALAVMHGADLGAVEARLRPDVDAEDGMSFAILTKVWREALDLSTRDRLCQPLAQRQGELAETVEHEAGDASRATPRPQTQSVWCIDVRSERVRRHLESLGDHETFGFAGFFGMTGRTIDPDGAEFDQAPVIVTPTIEMRLPDAPLGLLPAMTRTATRVAARPGLAFAVAEASGVAAYLAAVAGTVAPRTWRRLHTRGVRGPSPAGPVELRDLADPDRLISTAERADAAEGMLRAIGLTSGFAPLLVLTAHGSTTENNAFATAYDCGACGGNPGIVNARAMAQVLEEPAVRAELAVRGIHLPATTRVVAALHDTTTDEVHVHADGPDQLVHDVEATLARAGRLAAAERAAALPTSGRSGLAGRSLAARATDWSEAMPEWGLAGCAAIIVGPRSLTRGLDLGGRTFLHSYDRHADPDGTVLTALLNAPVVVSQWIASQYWFSSVAPTAFGAGDKTTHNVVGDIGVLSGAGGDLRVGLPWQAVFTRDPGARPDATAGPQHVPSSHLVVVDADPAVLARSVLASPAVLGLLTGGWVRMVAVDGGRVVDVLEVLAAQDTDTTAGQPQDVG